jgi:hypothetical protein
MRRIVRKWNEIWSGGATPRRDMENVFTEIYRSNAWGGTESVSGPGSTEQRGASFRDDLLAALYDLGTRVLLDAPCGDFNWIGPVADAIDRYVGVDVVPEIIAGNLRQHSGPNRQFLRLDLTRGPLPPADVVLCRDALVHFSFADIWRALANLRRSGARYLITTTFIGDRENEEIATGAWRPLNLERPPFCFPPPQRLIDERCWHTGGIYADKRLGVWRRRDVPARR